ncbi:MAG: GatB/YqeY domain-containing protein [Candidatus Nanopelagicales bacterium]|nr:GatB/YqeY domain-containing protein [Candidatus Nanopelagicales bacterium]
MADNGTEQQLKEQLRADLTTAMKARDEVGSATLRMVLTAITNQEVSGKEAKTLTDDEVIAVLSKEAKKRRESVEAYQLADRPELADRESAELAIIAAYLPAPLSDDEVNALVTEAITETGATGMPGMGAVMKIVQPKTAGRADGSKVAAEVKRQLLGG